MRAISGQSAIPRMGKRGSCTLTIWDGFAFDVFKPNSTSIGFARHHILAPGVAALGIVFCFDAAAADRSIAHQW
jgi:hypothetical protein